MPAPRCSKAECANIELQRIEGMYALTKVAVTGDKTVFHPASGIPVVCYVCPTCAEIKVYSAKALDEM